MKKDSSEFLQLKRDGNWDTIEFRRLDPEVLQEAFRLRFLVYSQRGYLDRDWEAENLKDMDEFDESGDTVHFGALLNGELIAYIRGIPGPNFPMSVFFNLENSEIYQKFGSDSFELGRFVVKKPNKGSFLPRNILFLFLLRQILRYCHDNGYKYSFAFITDRLKEKMTTLKMPFHEIDSWHLRYPRDGKMAPYFYDRKITPVYFLESKFSRYLDRVFKKFRIIKKIDSQTFRLRTGFYTFVLKLLKKL